MNEDIIIMTLRGGYIAKVVEEYMIENLLIVKDIQKEFKSMDFRKICLDHCNVNGIETTMDDLKIIFDDSFNFHNFIVKVAYQVTDERNVLN